MSQITFASNIQKLLFELELSGQLSDGYWENARPSNHWKTPCSAAVVVGDDIGVDFRVDVNYNFANKMLLDCVGDRMLMFVQAYIKFPNLSSRAIQMLDYGDWVFDKVTDAHYAGMLKEWQTIGIIDSSSRRAVLNELSTVNYTMKDLKKDLKAMSLVFKTRK